MKSAETPLDPLKLHAELRGKIATQPTSDVTPATLAALYTPGVGEVSRHLAEHPEATRDYTVKSNSLAVISDGSAVLGLGNIGPYGAMPVMEGKAMLFKSLAGINAWPLVLDTQDTEQIIATIKAVAPSFGAINLEDISAPRCYEIEDRLHDELDIPVMHDDQHATAIVVLAGIMNAMKVVGKQLGTARVVVVGAGAAGSAVARLLVEAGVPDVVLVDSRGIIGLHRTDLDTYKSKWAQITNPRELQGDAAIAFAGADAVVAVSGPGAITPAHIRAMAPGAIVFALANPTPEIDPAAAHTAGAAVVATGRSDYPNQINNVLVFPGIFKGMLASGVNRVTSEIKLRAAAALAGLVPHPTPERIIPSVFDEGVAEAVASSVAAVR